MNLGIIANVLIMAGSATALAIIVVNEARLRTTDPRSRFRKVAEHIKKYEPDTAAALDRLYRKIVKGNREGHMVLNIADAYLDALQKRGTTRAIDPPSQAMEPSRERADG